LAERAEVQPLSANFLGLILEKRRLLHLPEIVLAYEGLIDERLNRAKATVTSARSAKDWRTRRLSASGIPGFAKKDAASRFCLSSPAMV
jgi:F0F1-type ATP synthase delta subunit